MAVLRNDVFCVILGASAEVPESMLPTYRDVIKFYNFTRQRIKNELSTNRPHKEVSGVVLNKVAGLWHKASIPIVTYLRMEQMMESIYKEYRLILKNYKRDKDKDSYKEKLCKFKEKADRLFDISACKCANLYNCKCEKECKLPNVEKKFLIDQRNARQMIIGSIDKAETQKLENRSKRRALLKHCQITPRSCTTQSSTSSQVYHSDSNSDTECPDNSSTYIDASCPKKRKVFPKSLQTMATICDRYGVSDRAAAAIASSVLADVQGGNSLVIDRSKVRRERMKKRTALSGEASTKITGLYFDGRKDKTMFNAKDIDGKFHRKIISEEHITIIAEPGSSYFGHVCASNGTGAEIASKLLDYLEKRGVHTNELNVIGTDGTVVNTGVKKGAIRLIEESLDRPLQWCICLLHANEIPLRCLFQKIDGPTTGPHGFAGPIGKAVHTCDRQPLVNFDKIPCDLEHILQPKDLSTDQKYLFEICLAISKGYCSLDLSLKCPGTINQARWLTLANRILRLYISTEAPSIELKTVVTFILKVYAPMWFSIKKASLCTDGAKHVYNMVDKARYLEDDLKEVVMNAIQRNAYFAHPENVLLAMLGDDNISIRELALRRILKSRERKSSSAVRVFRVPTLNLHARNYIEIIDWQTEDITEPPHTKNLSNEDLINMIKTNPFTMTHLTVESFPCHNQAVERHVKLVTEASGSVCGEDNRDGFIRARLESRHKMPKFDSKGDFKV